MMVSDKVMDSLER